MPRTPGAYTRAIPRPSNNARARAWQSMRVLRRFAIPDLCATADIRPNNVKQYIDRLRDAGYLRLIQPRRSGVKGGHAVWMLTRDTGPYAPRIQRNGRIWDPNTHTVYPEDL